MQNTLIIDVWICITTETPFLNFPSYLVSSHQTQFYLCVSNAPQLSFSYCFAPSVHLPSIQALQVFSILSTLFKKSYHVHIKSPTSCLLVHVTHDPGYYLPSINVLFFPIPLYPCDALFKIVLGGFTGHIHVLVVLWFFSSPTFHSSLLQCRCFGTGAFCLCLEDSKHSGVDHLSAIVQGERGKEKELL